MDYFIIAAIAFYLGFKLNEKIMWFTFGKMMKEAGISNKDLDKFVAHWAPSLKEELEVTDKPQVEIRLEEHNQTLYAYRKDNEEFLGQGANQEELFKRIADRFQDVKFVLKQGDGAELLQKNNG
jgi:hypothetical protein